MRIPHPSGRPRCRSERTHVGRRTRRGRRRARHGGGRSRALHRRASLLGGGRPAAARRLRRTPRRLPTTSSASSSWPFRSPGRLREGRGSRACRGSWSPRRSSRWESPSARASASFRFSRRSWRTASRRARGHRPTPRSSDVLPSISTSIPSDHPILTRDRPRFVRLTRKWLLSGAFGRSTAKQADKALVPPNGFDVRSLTDAREVLGHTDQLGSFRVRPRPEVGSAGFDVGSA